MLVTVVTLHRADMCETFVAVVEGSVSQEERQAFAAGYNLVYDENDGHDYMTFVEVETKPKISDWHEMPNIMGKDQEGYIEAPEPDEDEEE